MVNQDSFWLRIIYIVSVIITAAVAFLILGPRPEGIGESLDVSKLPLFNDIIDLWLYLNSAEKTAAA